MRIEGVNLVRILHLLLKTESNCHCNTVTSTTSKGESLLASPNEVEPQIDAKIVVNSEVKAEFPIQIREQTLCIRS